MARARTHWKDHIEDVVRSRHYTWLPDGLGGQPVDAAMSCLVTDIMHVCHRTGVTWDRVIAEAAARFEQEERDSTIPNTID